MDRERRRDRRTSVTCTSAVGSRITRGPGTSSSRSSACGHAGFSNTSGWCDDALEGEIDEALLLTTTDRGAANRTWAEIDRRLVEDAAQAPVTNPVFTHAVADRVENVQVHPQWGLMLSLIWVQ